MRKRPRSRTASRLAEIGVAVRIARNGRRPWSRSLRLVSALHEREHAPPGVVAFRLVLREAPVEEGVRRARIRLEVVLHAHTREGLVEGGDVRRRDARIVSAEETQDRRAHALCFLRRDRPGLALPLRETTVKPDNAPEIRLLRRRE